MFKRAKVLYAFDKITCKTMTYNDLKVVLSGFNLDVDLYPDYSDSAKALIFKNLIPKTLLCITQNTGTFTNDYAFLCAPASSLNISMAIKPGEDVWYFEDETFSNNDLKDTHMIKFYWVSRIIGNLNTEYLSHTNSFEGFESLYNEEINKPVNTTLVKTSIDNDITEYGRPRYFSDLNEVAIQGDKGNIIRLGNASQENDSGVIDIVAGRNHYDPSGFDNQPEEESLMSFSADASRIFVSELGYFNEDNFDIDDVYNDKLTYTKIVKNKYDEEYKGFLFDESKYTIKTYEEKENLYEKIRELNQKENDESVLLEDHIDNDIMPNITLKSSTINIISKENYNKNNEFVVLEEDESEDAGSESPFYDGQIRLLRESSFTENSSQILLDNNNDIILDGNTIYLGNFNRMLLDKSLINTSDLNDGPLTNIIDSLEDDKKTILKEMCGKGESVLLGYESTLAEPLVLGNTLIVLLKDMIDLTQLLIKQNKTLNTQVKDMSSEYSTFIKHYNTHTHISAGPSNPTLPTAPTSTDFATHQQFSTKMSRTIDTDLDKISSNFEEVKKNLKYVLSRFAKTS